MSDFPDYEYLIDLLRDYAGCTESEFCVGIKEIEALHDELAKAEEIIHELVRLARHDS